jgi:ankyrin repeat protein
MQFTISYKDKFLKYKNKIQKYVKNSKVGGYGENNDNQHVMKNIGILQKLLLYMMPIKIKDGGNYKNILTKIKELSSLGKEWEEILIGDLELDFGKNTEKQQNSNDDDDGGLFSDMFATHTDKELSLDEILENLKKGELDATKYIWKEWGLLTDKALLYFVKNGVLFATINNLKYGGDNRFLDMEDNNHFTLLMLASKHGHIEIVKLLLKYPIRINAIRSSSDTALSLAVENGHKDIARILLEHGANVNIHLGDQTPLIWCSKNGDEKITELLLMHGANPNIIGNPHPSSWSNRTPLEFATEAFNATSPSVLSRNRPRSSFNDYTETVKHLLNSKKIDFNYHKQGIEALRNAARINSLPMVKLLAPHVNLNPDHGAWSALSISAKNNMYDIVKVLLENGADPTHSSNTGALRSAISNKNISIAKLIIGYIDFNKLDPEDLDEYIEIILNWIGGNGDFKELAEFLITKVNLNPDEKSYSALKHAVKRYAAPNPGDVEYVYSYIKKYSDSDYYVKFLLEHGADPTFGGNTDALKILIEKDKFEIINLMLDHINFSKITPVFLNEIIERVRFKERDHREWGNAIRSKIRIEKSDKFKKIYDFLLEKRKLYFE